MAEQLPDTWASRDFPVLKAVVRVLDAHPVGGPADQGGFVAVQQVAELTGLTLDDVRRAGANLERAGLVKYGGPAEIPIAYFTDFSREALRLVGAWPTPETGLDRMIAALEAIAANTVDADTRTRAQRILEALSGAGRQVGIGVATAVVTGQIPS